jgi:hypothetical protein
LNQQKSYANRCSEGGKGGWHVYLKYCIDSSGNPDESQSDYFPCWVIVAFSIPAAILLPGQSSSETIWVKNLKSKL